MEGHRRSFPKNLSNLKVTAYRQRTGRSQTILYYFDRHRLKYLHQLFSKFFHYSNDHHIYLSHLNYKVSRMPRLKRGRGISERSLREIRKKKRSLDKVNSALYRKRRKHNYDKAMAQHFNDNSDSDIDSSSTNLSECEGPQVTHVFLS